jgi:hypothetical protein
VANSDPDLTLVGKVLEDRYEVLEPIGSGGVGSVYRARRIQLERIVAVKVLHESLVTDSSFVRRFQLEAAAMSRLHHPHCLSVIDCGVHEARPYLVLEYVPGETVNRLLEQAPFTPARSVHIALQLLDALEYFHSHHVIHRDLKSENVMLVESSGSADFVKVLDFGMAKIVAGPGADSQLSKIGFIPGTPSAMAPEQIRQIPPDPRIDIYATGILLYEMIVGRRPFTGPDHATVIKMQLSATPSPPRELLGEGALSAELEQVILKALEKDRLDRFATATEMAAALRATPEGRPAPHSLRPGQRALRGFRPAWVALGVFAMLGVLGSVAALLKPSAPSPAASIPPRTEQAPVRAAAPSAAIPDPVPVIETWLAHRDLAITYRDRGQHDEALREVQSALADNPSAAAAEPSLTEVAVHTLTPERVEWVVQTFRENPRLVDALALAVAEGATRDLRIAALDGLRRLEREDRADLVAMALLDIEQAPDCRAMRAVFNQLRRTRDARVKNFIAQLRTRSRADPQAKCLGRGGAQPAAKRSSKQRTARARPR